MEHPGFRAGKTSGPARLDKSSGEVCRCYQGEGNRFPIPVVTHFEEVSFGNDGAGKVVDWMEKVSDEQYRHESPAWVDCAC